MLLGGEKVAEPTLTRFFYLHILILPVTLMTLIWLHLKMIWNTRVSAPEDVLAIIDPDVCIGCCKCVRACEFDAIEVVLKADRKYAQIHPLNCNACRVCFEMCPVEAVRMEYDGKSLPFEPIFPHNIVRRVTAVSLGYLIYISMAYFMPEFSKIPANPVTTPVNIKPDWYFLAPYQVLKLLPNELFGILLLFAICLFVTFLPFFDRKGPRNHKNRPVHFTMTLIGITAFFILTIWGWVS